MNGKQLLGIGVVVILAVGIVRFILGPIYVSGDGCECGRYRQWYNFEFRPLCHQQLFLRVIAEGDPHHPHEYWDATWSEQFWFFPHHAARRVANDDE